MAFAVRYRSIDHAITTLLLHILFCSIVCSEALHQKSSYPAQTLVDSSAEAEPLSSADGDDSGGEAWLVLFEKVNRKVDPGFDVDTLRKGEAGSEERRLNQLSSSRAQKALPAVSTEDLAEAEQAEQEKAAAETPVATLPSSPHPILEEERSQEENEHAERNKPAEAEVLAEKNNVEAPAETEQHTLAEKHRLLASQLEELDRQMAKVQGAEAEEAEQKASQVHEEPRVAEEVIAEQASVEEGQQPAKFAGLAEAEEAAQELALSGQPTEETKAEAKEPSAAKAPPLKVVINRRLYEFDRDTMSKSQGTSSLRGMDSRSVHRDSAWPRNKLLKSEWLVAADRQVPLLVVPIPMPEGLLDNVTTLDAPMPNVIPHVEANDTWTMPASNVNSTWQVHSKTKVKVQAGGKKSIWILWACLIAATFILAFAFCFIWNVKGSSFFTPRPESNKQSLGLRSGMSSSSGEQSHSSGSGHNLARSTFSSAPPQLHSHHMDVRNGSQSGLGSTSDLASQPRLSQASMCSSIDFQARSTIEAPLPGLPLCSLLLVPDNTRLMCLVQNVVHRRKQDLAFDVCAMADRGGAPLFRMRVAELGSECPGIYVEELHPGRSLACLSTEDVWRGSAFPKLSMFRAGGLPYGTIQKENDGEYNLMRGPTAKLLIFAGNFQEHNIQVMTPEGHIVATTQQTSRSAYEVHIQSRSDAGLIVLGLLAIDKCEMSNSS